jgi:hypothetical protein
MRRILFVFALFILLFTACAPEAGATEEPSIPETEEPSAPTESATQVPTESPAELSPVEDTVVAHLAESSGISPAEITVVSTEEVEWPDGCLGIQLEGLMCTQVIVPGFRIILESNGREVEYRTNEDGTQIRPATVLMTWTREGGIAGFCDHLIVYLSGEVHKTSCKSEQPVEESLTAVLSEAELETLNEWIESYGNVNIDASDPQGVSDRMVVTLELMGLGDQETVSAANEQELLDFAQALHQGLSK